MSDHALTGSCHCGAVRVTVPRRPEYINDCNCTLCTKHGATWIYFKPAEVGIKGETASYIRADAPEPCLATHWCQACGCTTHWSPLLAELDRMGVNAGLFDPEMLAGVEVRAVDGRSWPV